MIKILCTFFVVVICACAVNASEGPPMKYCPPEDPNCHPSCIEYDANSCRYCRCKTGESSDGDGTGNAHSFGGNLFSLESGMTSSNSGSGSSWSNGETSSSSGSGSWGGDSNGGSWGGDSNGGSWGGDSNGGSWGGDSNGGSWGGDSNSESWGGNSNSGGWEGSTSNSNDNGEKIKYIIINENGGNNEQSSGTGLPFSPFSPLHGPSPFAGGMHSSMGLPMSLSSMHGPASVPEAMPTVPPGYHIENVMTSGVPGVPAHCVRDKLLCPSHCLTVDEHGCHSCPCAPASVLILPVLIPDERPTKASKTECTGTLLCMLSCKDGYRLGDKDQNGCPSCTCIKKKPTTTPPPKIECKDTITCVISCAVKQKGYKIGGTDHNGCPSCHCLDNNTSSHSDNGGHTLNSNNGLNQQQSNQNSNGNTMLSSNGNNMLSNTNNGMGGGDGGCTPPMCQGGGTGFGSSGSGTMGSGSSSLSEMPHECKPPLSYANCAGLAGSSSTSSGNSATGSGSCVGPFCASGSGSGGMGSGGGGMTSGSVVGSGGNTDASGGGGSCSGPFCAGGSGMGGGGGSGGMGMGGGSASTGGMMGSPFMAAASGSGGPGMGGMSMPGSPGMGSGGMMAGGPFHSGVGPHGPMTPGSLPTNEEVLAVASNTDCFGPLCSSKSHIPNHDVDEEECPELLECMLRCDPVFDTNTGGCPRCTCPGDEV